ncbi:hypothetical protein [Helicobacter salomonis]|uniref:hypothetical protein n=1 Tax=Helicobacter salomonis TaxID=56878 RepID=UPI00131588DF|nr:hypothetical protein [Helicobacter salomonis]
MSYFVQYDTLIEGQVYLKGAEFEPSKTDGVLLSYLLDRQIIAEVRPPTEEEALELPE